VTVRCFARGSLRPVAQDGAAPAARGAPTVPEKPFRAKEEIERTVPAEGVCSAPDISGMVDEKDHRLFGNDAVGAPRVGNRNQGATP
jgi:hypothetical protein